jgi:uncharacterized ferritin-like protein (DUF455 family)
MEISGFASKVLFSVSLEEKLAFPGRLSDDAPGVRLHGVPEPGRPPDLMPRKKAERSSLPKAAQFVDEEQRGILLHFFANHELLATELMALALLKFPEAPKAFRIGLARTLREEQRHTRWYMERMSQCGVRFGDFPVNRFFWDMIAPMESPLDYVSRLSLTFEQANLDYAKHFAAMMRECGDDRTAAILERIYKDEIGHVGYGLKWFRKWKREGESDWQAFGRSLRFPLSPSRAKGNGAPFNAEGRAAAGLDEDFIRNLRVFERSRGRVPNVYFFNPDVEASLVGAGGKAKAVRMLERDLEIVGAFLARREDVVLVRELPSVALLERLQRWGFELPEFELLQVDGKLNERGLLRGRKVGLPRPWGWCPEAARAFGGLIPAHEARERIATTRIASTKAWSVELAAGLDESGGSHLCRTMEEVRAAVLGCEGAVALVKAPYAASARGNRRYTKDSEPWIARLLSTQGAVVVEPWRERVFDFSVQFEMEATGLRRLGFTRLHNTTGGQFIAVEAGPRLLRGLSPEIAVFLMNRGAGEAGGLMERTYETVAATLEAAFRAIGYLGPVGIDAFVYRDSGGALRLRPVVEINPRYTMGRLAWELRRRVGGRTARFSIGRKSDEPSAEDHGVLDANGRLAEGRVFLNSPADAVGFLAVLEVAR